jgi:hypothetical protein
VLHPQVVVNLFAQVCVRMDVVKHGHDLFGYPGATAIA